MGIGGARSVAAERWAAPVGLYRDRILPAFYDKVMDRPELAEHRRRQLAGLSGDVLEIGIGTGLNLPGYPDEVTSVHAVEPNPGMNRRLDERARAARMPVERHAMSGEELPFDAGRFDHAVSTMTLCSIADVDRAVAEIRRVLRPGGTFVFFEHGLHDDPGVRRWQRRLEWLQRLYADCSLLLDVRAVLERADFADLDVETFLLDGAPRIHQFMYRGRATR